VKVDGRSVKPEAAKPHNTVDGVGATVHPGSLMSRTPNASKKVIFAFVARIHLR
jgi:hypothetical protein